MSGAASAKPQGEGATPEAIGTVFSPHVLVFQLNAREGSFRHLDLLATLTLTNRWREAILSHTNGLPESVRRMLSGHGADGGPAEEPHLAFLPLAFVGNEHADGHLLGMGLALPVHLSRDERREALRAIAAVHDLKMGPLGVWQIEPVTAEQPPQTLRPEAWTTHPKGATHWCTVTPIVLDRHPDHRRLQSRGLAEATRGHRHAGFRPLRRTAVIRIPAPPAQGRQRTPAHSCDSGLRRAGVRPSVDRRGKVSGVWGVPTNGRRK